MTMQLLHPNLLPSLNANDPQYHHEEKNQDKRLRNHGTCLLGTRASFSGLPLSITFCTVEVLTGLDSGGKGTKGLTLFQVTVFTDVCLFDHGILFIWISMLMGSSRVSRVFVDYLRRSVSWKVGGIGPRRRGLVL
jgi:hypothetical protein